MPKPIDLLKQMLRLDEEAADQDKSNEKTLRERFQELLKGLAKEPKDIEFPRAQFIEAAGLQKHFQSILNKSIEKQIKLDEERNNKLDDLNDKTLGIHNLIMEK